MFRISKVTPLPGYRLQLRFEDGVEGEVDLSDLAGRGVFAIWDDPEVFGQVAIGAHGELVWPGGVDQCPDSLYLKVTGKSASEVFPGLKSAAHA
jgi:hypothetical protein